VKKFRIKSRVTVSARKRAEEALRESEAAYRGLVENATYGICSVTLAGKLVRVNPALVQMLGYDSELPVIFTTGHSSDIPLLHTVQNQGLPILQKPYSPRDLGRKVREMLDLRVASLSHP
jgi:PAS domain-containing protein